MEPEPRDQQPYKSGYVAIVGRPNVGKSTLLNRILGQKVAIVTPKPQTTRGRILGIHTTPMAQVVFVDTPGLHKAKSALNRRMVDAAEQAIEDADLVLWVVDAMEGITPAVHALAAQWREKKSRLCIAVNKIDRLGKTKLIPFLAELATVTPEREIVPISAASGENVDRLIDVLIRFLPQGPALFPADEVTDQSERVLVQEAVREQILLQADQEVPYAAAVTVDRFEERPRVTVVSATIHVERESQKRILVGHGGSRIRAIGQAARLELEKMLGRRLYLELFVRVQAEWTTNPSHLAEFGL